jgi:hypothetical protein
MRHLLLIAIALTWGFTHAQESPWSGKFEGTIIGINATITAEAIGPEWNGDINASGYPLKMSGMITDNTCSGIMSDPQTGAESAFAATMDGSTLIIVIRDVNPNTGQIEDMQFPFIKTAPASGALSKTVAVTVHAEGVDDALVGTWRYTDTYVSGDFSVATDYFMQFDPDGRAYVTDGRTAGGNFNASFDSGAGDVHQATWKAENKVLYFSDGTSGWQAYATYYAEPARMMLTYNNGKKQVWEKL